MTPKQMARLGVFQIQEAILSVLEQEPAGLKPEEISTTLGVPDRFIVQGVLDKLHREGYIEPTVNGHYEFLKSNVHTHTRESNASHHSKDYSKRGKSPATRICVTLLDGTIIEHESGIDTFLDILEMFGLEEVDAMRLGSPQHPLVKRHIIDEPIPKERKPDTSGKWTVYSVLSTAEKRDYLNQIQSLSEKPVFSEVVIKEK
ncbi:MAG: hypothetical protein OXN27_09405 [Candidatus Poribacteria bacterium]|nr:hypothetical protein [Candidatus Poribacteria bacterium]